MCNPGSIGVPAGRYLYQGDWWTHADALEPGEYTVRFTFNPGLEVNHRTTVIPDEEVAVGIS